METGSGTNESCLLTSWKDIANYMGKGVRTVQRWEAELGLPVRRPRGAVHKSAVAAWTRDLDAWLSLHWSRRDSRPSRHNGSQAGRRRANTLSDEIRTSQELRTAHQMLVSEVRAALQALVHSFTEISAAHMAWRMSSDRVNGEDWPLLHP
jgi:hypothetical protein